MFYIKIFYIIEIIIIIIFFFSEKEFFEILQFFKVSNSQLLHIFFLINQLFIQFNIQIFLGFQSLLN